MQRHIRGGSIVLYSGAYFDFTAPNGDLVFIHDIARGLANTCRFGGQSERFYSVAEHSVLASQHVPNKWAYEALMHDAAEALIGDIPKPLKQLLPDFMNIERQVEEVVADRFGFSPHTPDTVKLIDIQMLAAEQTQVMGNDDSWAFTHGLQAAPVTIEFWSPTEAYERFLRRYFELRDLPQPTDGEEKQT